MPNLQVTIPGALAEAMDAEIARSGGTTSSIVTTAGPVIVGIHVDYSDNHSLFEQLHEDSIH